MSDISILSRLIAGIPRNVDISANTLVTTSIKVGGSVSNTELTKAILDRLLALQNGSDVDATYHTHDNRYYTKTQLNSTTSGSSGAKQIGVSGTPANFSPATADVQAYLNAIDSALGSASNAFDGTFRIKNTAIPTKQIAFDASGISASTTRTMIMPDADVNLGKVNTAIQKDGSVIYTANQPMGGFKLTGLAAGSSSGDSVRYEQAILTNGVNAFAADQSFGGFKATNLADPSASQDAVTLAFLNARLNGLTPKAPVRAATTVAGSLSSSFANGSIIDNVTLVTGNRILIKDQSTASENGIYIVQASGAPVRAVDMDSLTPYDEFNGAWTTVQEGTQAGKVFVQYGNVTTVGTDAVNFQYYNPIAGLIGGDMITFAGSAFSVDLATSSGLKSTNSGSSAGQLTINLEATNPTLMIDGSNQLAVKYAAGSALSQGSGGLAVLVDDSTLEISTSIRIKDSGVTLAKLASNSVDENKIVSTTYSPTGAITGGSGTKVAVNVDATSIEISSNALRIKSTAYDQSTIVGGSGTAASVAQAPKVVQAGVAGEAFAANTTFLVRKAVSGETAGRWYKADYDATSANNFYVYGIIEGNGAAAKSAGDSINVVLAGTIQLGSADTAFSSTKVGEPVHLKASGAFDAVSNISYAINQASYRVGMVEDTNKILVGNMQLLGIN